MPTTSSMQNPATPEKEDHMDDKDWQFSHNFTDAGAKMQSAYRNVNDPLLQLNVVDDDGNAFLFRDNVFVCNIPRLRLRRAGV